MKKYCNICKDYYEFMDFGYNKRPKVQCPNCGSLERHRLHFSYLEKKDLKRINILHFAPEECMCKVFLDMHSNIYIKLDINFKCKYINCVADIQNLPFKDNFFQLIYCSHVLEHVKNDYKALYELKRVLSFDGFCLICVPINKNLDKTLEEEWINTPELRAKYYGQPDHLRYYGKDFINRVLSVGLVIEESIDSTSFIVRRN